MTGPVEPEGVMLDGLDRDLDPDGRAWWQAQVAEAVDEWMAGHRVAVTSP